MNDLWADVLLCFLIWSIALTLLLILPAWLLVTGIKRKRRWRVLAGTVWLASSCVLVALVADPFSTRHEGILDHGTTPDGREYVLFQVWNGEPYAVQLYVRNTNGGWRFYYVDHEVWPWRHGGQIDFSDGKVCVFCGEELFRVLDIDEENGSESERYPNYMTAEEVFNSCRYYRNRKGLTK